MAKQKALPVTGRKAVQARGTVGPITIDGAFYSITFRTPILAQLEAPIRAFHGGPAAKLPTTITNTATTQRQITPATREKLAAAARKRWAGKKTPTTTAATPRTKRATPKTMTAGA